MTGPWVVAKPALPRKIGDGWVDQYWCRPANGPDSWGELPDAAAFDSEEAAVAALRAKFGPAWATRFKGPRPVRIEAAGE